MRCSVAAERNERCEKQDLTAQQMVALNINPQTFVAEQIAAVKAEFDATDRLKAQTSVQAVLSQTVNPNLVGAV